MKFFSLLGVALAKECYDAVLPTGARAERGEVSVGELKVAIEEFSACAERDVHVDVTPLYETETKGTVKVSVFAKISRPRFFCRPGFFVEMMKISSGFLNYYDFSR